MGRKKREPNFVKCEACQSIFDKNNRSNYCMSCRDVMRRRSNAEKEKARREKQKDEINAKRREEYRNRPERREMLKESKKRYYQKHMSDPDLKKSLNERARIAQAKHRIKTKFGGNGTKALERDNYKCVKCESTDMLAIHHVDGNGSNLSDELQNNDLDNLVTLCSSCHARTHRSHEKEGKSSLYQGVYKGKGRSGWQSKIIHKGKSYYLGTFKTEAEAFNAYMLKKKELNIS